MPVLLSTALDCLRCASQVLCYEDARLMKLFSDIVKLMYNGDLVGEDTIQHWYKKGSHPKGRNVFLKVRSVTCGRQSVREV
jgi:ABC-type dipeptide/oligopeptide/nickel transport system ATPase subunit